MSRRTARFGTGGTVSTHLSKSNTTTTDSVSDAMANAKNNAAWPTAKRATPSSERRRASTIDAMTTALAAILTINRVRRFTLLRDLSLPALLPRAVRLRRAHCGRHERQEIGQWAGLEPHVVAVTDRLGELRRRVATTPARRADTRPVGDAGRSVAEVESVPADAVIREHDVDAVRRAI